MVRLKILKPIVLLAVMAACAMTFVACSSQTATTGAAGSSSTTDLIGKVTAVNGSTVTLALGTMSGGRGGGAGGIPPTGKKGTTSGVGNPQGTPQNGKQGGTPPSGNQGAASGSGTQPGGMQGGLTLTGKTKTITISDTSILSKQTMPAGGQGGPGGDDSTTSADSTTSSDATVSQSSTATLSDITVGTILRVEYDSSGKMTSVVIMGGAQADSATTSATAATTSSTSAVTVAKTRETKSQTSTASSV